MEIDKHYASMRALLLLAAACAEKSAPVVAIYPTIDGSYLDAYKEWVGQFGADSMVLPHSATDDELEKIFNSVNGLLIPGGGSDLATLAKSFVDRAIKANQNGDYFPVWGTCLGFEWILETIGGTSVLDKGFDSEDYPHVLNFTSAAPGRIFANANSSLMKWFASENIVYANHVAGITPQDEAKNAALTKFFDVLATSMDRNGRPFVAIIQGKSVPIYGSQFHSEKIQFVNISKKDAHIPKTPEAVAGAKYLAKFFVSEVMKNKHNTNTTFH